MNKDTQDRINALKQEEILQNNLADILHKNLDYRTKQGKVARDLVNELVSQKGVEDKLLTVLETKQKLLEGEFKLDKDRAKLLLKELEDTEELLKKEKRRKDLQDDIKDIGNDFVKDLGDTLGVSNDLVKALMAGSAAAIGFAIMKEVIGWISDSVKRMKELHHHFGATSKQTFQMQGNLTSAKMSVEGFLLGTDKLDAAMTNIAETTGKLNVPPQMITDVAALSEMMDGADAINLARSLKNAGQSTEELREFAGEYAAEVGGNAAEGLKYLSKNQMDLNKLTKEQIQQRIKEGIEVKKMGADMEHINDVASQALDIGQSLAAEAKLRAFTGKDISFNELRAAQLSGDKLAVAQAEKKLVDQLGDSLDGNLQLQRIISEQTGMTKEQMIGYKNATMEAVTAGENLGETAEETGGFWSGLKDTALSMLPTILAVVAGLTAFQLLSKGLSKLGMGKSNPIADFMKGFGNTEVLMGAAAMAVVAASLWVLGKAVQEFMKVRWQDVVKAMFALGVLTISIMALGQLFATGMGAFLIAGAAAMLIVAGAVWVLGKAIQEMAKGFGMMANLSDNLTGLIEVSPALISLAEAFTLFGLSLIPLAIGLAALSPVLPELLALGAVTGIVAAIMGTGGESSGSESNGGGSKEGGSDPLLEEIKGLRADIKSQPILIEVDGKVVSAITKAQRRFTNNRSAYKTI